MLRLGVLGLIVAATALVGATRRDLEVAPAVHIVGLPEGGIQPQAAADRAGTAHVVFFKGDPGHGDIFYTRVSRAGRFAPPIQVNTDAGSAIATGTVRGAHVAIGRNGGVHVAWMGSSASHAPGAPAPVFYTRLASDGRRFEPQRNIMRTPAVGPDGASLAAGSDGRVYVIWHALAEGGKGEGDRRLWLAVSDDDGATFAAERPVSDPEFGACACCGTGAFASADGTLYALFRAARGGVHRDTFLLRSTDRGARFAPMDIGPWDINACPMSTYAFAQDPSSGRVAAAWETDGLVYWGRPGARTGWDGLRAGSDVKNQRHPALAINGRGETLVAWTEGTGWNRGGTIAWQVFDEVLNRAEERGSAAGLRPWGTVTAFARRDGSFTIVY